MSVSEDTADIVIAGGGTAACVIAGRLNDALPQLKIVIVECGPDSKGNETIKKPLASMFQIWQAAETVKYHKTEKEECLDGREAIIPMGNTVGGGTCVNWMFYQNAAASDFDDWSQPGWSFAELLPTIRKSIKYEVENGDMKVHSRDGVMPVSHGNYSSDIGADIREALPRVLDMPELDDVADFKRGHGYGKMARYISTSGERSTASEQFLYNKPRPNVTVISKKTVNRVVFEGNRASGIEICDVGPAGQPPSFRTISATKQVIICAGAFGSPTILERSGLGDRTVLERLGIESKVDLPGVGKQYLDHHAFLHAYHTGPRQGYDAFARKEGEAVKAAEEQWVTDGSGKMGTGFVDYIYKLRPSEKDVEALGPDFAEHWNKVGLDKSDKPLMTGAFAAMFFGHHLKQLPGDFMTIAAWLNYPASTGSLHIRSASPYDPPVFHSGMLSNPIDIAIHVWAYKLMREIARRMPCYKGENILTHPTFPEGSAATCGPVDNPSRDLADDDRIVYTPEDDQIIETWLRARISTTFHSMGTCPMRAREEGGVVDHRLDVHGVSGLKIADMSIVPSNVGTNTASVALIIGEKCAEMLVEELQRGMTVEVALRRP